MIFTRTIANQYIEKHMLSPEHALREDREAERAGGSAAQGAKLSNIGEPRPTRATGDSATRERGAVSLYAVIPWTGGRVV